jgi:putative transposase
VRVACEEGKLSERRACGLVDIARGSVRYERRQRDDRALRARMKELAAKRPRFGYRRLHVLLRREKKEDGAMRWQVNHKRVYRLYREEGLAMRRKASKRLRSEARTPLELPTQANQMWTMDFTHDSMANGRKFRTLNLMDGYSREALAIEVDTSLPGARVVCVLERLKLERGLTAKIIVDNVLTTEWYREAGAKISCASDFRRDCSLNPSGFHRQQKWHSTIATQGPLKFRSLHCT